MKYIKLSKIILIFTYIIIPSSIFAQDVPTSTVTSSQDIITTTSLEDTVTSSQDTTVVQSTTTSEEQLAQNDPFELEPIDENIALGDRPLPEIVGNLINIALSLLGIILLVLILYSGLLWMTAGGDEEKTKKARGTLIAAIIGLIIILASGSISRFVIDSLSSATGTDDTNTQF